MKKYLSISLILFVFVAAFVVILSPVQEVHEIRSQAVGEQPTDIPNTPIYTQRVLLLSGHDIEEAADKDISRMEGDTMHVAIKDNDDTEQFGYASIEEHNGEVAIDIHTEDSEAPLEVKQTTILYHGTCVKKGVVYKALTDVYSGKSKTVLPLSMQELQQQLPLAIYIYRGENDLSAYNSCGELPIEK